MRRPTIPDSPKGRAVFGACVAAAAMVQQVEDKFGLSSVEGHAYVDAYVGAMIAMLVEGHDDAEREKQLKIWADNIVHLPRMPEGMQEELAAALGHVVAAIAVEFQLEARPESKEKPS